MKLIITIDTEEDCWRGYLSSSLRTDNIGRLLRLEDLFAKYDVGATYLVSYPVATRDDSLAVMEQVVRAGRCEIGAHCHPWNTPPVVPITSKSQSMLSALPPELQYQKLSNLDSAIQKNLKVKARSFRAGRWAFDDNVAKTLMRLGYIVDTSISPHVSWAKLGGCDHSRRTPTPSWIEHADVPDKRLLELPPTVGFLQSNETLAARAYELLSNDRLKHLHIKGILDRLRLLNRVWLSPELSSLKNMIALTERIVRQRPEMLFLNFTFHSSSLQAGLTPFVKTKADEAIFLRTIEQYLRYVRSLEIESVRLQDAAKLVPTPDRHWPTPFVEEIRYAVGSG